MKFKAGFLGAGNMGGALAQAAARAVGAQQIALCDHNKAKTDALGFQTQTAQTLARESEFLFLGVKPQVFAAAAAEIAGQLGEQTVAVSMAAGLSIDAVKALLGEQTPVIRIMPNTPVAVGAGMTLLCASAEVSAAQLAAFRQLMQCSGKLLELPEKLIDAGSALSGCGPAFVYIFMEALSDGAVDCGLPRAQAIACAAQTVLGAATMVLETGKHCGELKDAVLSPGGTTVEGVRALEQAGFRSACIEAVAAAYAKTMQLKK